MSEIEKIKKALNDITKIHTVDQYRQWLRWQQGEIERLTAFCKEWAGEEDKFQDFGGWDRIEKMKAEIQQLREELAEEKRHAALGWEQSNKWLEENGRLRAELDKSDREVISKGRELHELRTELAEKDKVLEWYAQGKEDDGLKAEFILNHFKKGDTADA